MKGKRLPMVDRVEVSIIEESQPRWLAFLNGELDWINLPYEFTSMALPGGKLAPWLAKRGVRYMPGIEPDVTYIYFNMKDPIVGGYTPEKVALRRAISLAYDIERRSTSCATARHRGRSRRCRPACWATTRTSTWASTYDPARPRRCSTCSATSTATATAGATCPTAARSSSSTRPRPSSSRASSRSSGRRTWTRSASAWRSTIAKWPDLRKKSKLGKLQNWDLAWGADYPDGENFYQLLYGPNCGSSNDGCFQLAEFDALYDKAAAMPPAARSARRSTSEMARLVAVYAPWKLHVHRKRNQMVQPWVLGLAQAPVPARGLPLRGHRPRAPRAEVLR